jgi:AcrR family transcriptional regulator
MSVRTHAQPVRPTSGLSVNQAARRQRIVDAALSLLDGQPYERVQVKDVADGASVALGTVYHYFASKEHLFGEVLVQWAGTLPATLTRRPVRAHDPASRLEDLLHRSVRAFERKPQLARLIYRLEASDDPFARDVLARLDDVTTTAYLTALGGLDPDLALRIVRVADAVLDSALRSWSAGLIPVSQVYRQLSDAVDLLLPGDGQLPPGSSS